MKTELSPMRKDWMEMKNMIIQLKHRTETMEGGSNTEKNEISSLQDALENVFTSQKEMKKRILSY